MFARFFADIILFLSIENQNIQYLSVEEDNPAIFPILTEEDKRRIWVTVK